MNITLSTQIGHLINKAEIVDMRYRKANEKRVFNIFNILSRKFDEVHLHSRFIYELLCPTGMHGMGTVFLERLLSQLEIADFSLNNLSVLKEHKNIDLLILNDNQAIIIENKLWASDQPAQLQRYYEYISSRGLKDIRIYYLSIDGKDAEDYSIGTLKHNPQFDKILQNLSYSFDIDHWLEDCIKEAYDRAALRETLIQYRLLIQEISGKTMGKEEKMEIIDLISQHDNVIYAKKIVENWNHVRWHTEWDFWTGLEAMVSAEYKVMELQKFSDKKITSNIHQARNRNPWFGIMFSIGTVKGDDACIFIERGQEDVYYGLTMVRENSKRFCNDTKFQPLREKVAEFSDWDANEHWIGGNYCLPRINFNTFSGEETLRLLNVQHRAAYLAGLWEQIKQFTTQVKAAVIEVTADFAPKL